MSIREELDIYAQVYQRQIQLEPSVECLALINKARQDGLPLREVFVLNQPLTPLAGGGCNTQDGEIWVLQHSEQEDEVLQTLRLLLHELAHLQSPPPLPYQTVDEDWDEEQHTWERAYELARRWGMEQMLSEEVLREELEFIEKLREDHWAAGLLAGSTHPRLARRAYQGLMALCFSQQWTPELFSHALQGWSDDDFANAVVVDFDRTILRSSWKLPWSQGGSFGRCLTLAQNDESARFLRHTLECIAQMRMPSPPTWRVMHNRQVCFFEIDESQSFVHALFWTQRLLLDYDTANGMSALVHWWFYADETPKQSPHLYRLSISYSPSFLALREKSLTAEQEPAQRIKYLETAWQRYLLSWLRTQELRCEPLHEGLPILWSWLK